MRHSVVLSAAFAAVSLAARVLAQDAAPPSANSNTAPAGDAVAAAESTPPEPPADASAEAAEAAPRPLPPAGEYVLAERPEALRGLARVAITSFALEYMTFLEAKTEGNWGNLIGNKPNDVSVKMVGQDTSGWQPVADAFYDRLVADLEAAGFEVVPQEQVRAAARYAAIAKAAETVPREVSGRAGKGTYYGARDLPVLIQDEAAVFKRGFQLGKPPEDLYMSVGTKIAAGFTTAGAMNAERALAKELGAHVLKVRLTVLPTQVSADHSFWVGGHVTTRASRSRETSSATPPRASWSTPPPPPRRPAKSPASASASSARSPASPHPAPSANPRTTNFASTTPPTRRPSQKS
jgi:hypothetical protein